MAEMGHCSWALVNERNRRYHDEEWGIPVRGDDRKMFEHLSLECLQCGLSWDLMLKKRQVFRACFDDFEIDRVAGYTETDVQRILTTPEMLRSEQKIRAVISNAQCCQKLRKEYGSLCAYLWSYTGGSTVVYHGHAQGAVPVSNGLSERICRDMKKRGFRYIGPVTLYSHLQACGIINDHADDCPCFSRINAMGPVVYLPPEDEQNPDREGEG